jgi:D-xylose transport system permease protein
VSVAAPGEVQSAATEDDGLLSAARRYWETLKAGDVGSLPVIIALAAMVLFFSVKNSNFFTAVNFNNLIVQSAGVTLVAIGVVFVLLLGEIDLSVSYLGGVAGVIVAELQAPGSGHDLGGIAAIAIALLAGVALGFFQGSWVALIGVPSFVVTLAGNLFFQGVILRALGIQGTISIQNHLVNDMANYYLSDIAGWIVAVLVVGGYALVTVGGIVQRRRHGLRSGNLTLALLRLALVALVGFGAVAICNNDRGVPFAGLLVVAMIAFWTYVAMRTTFGRHVYAVGGNAEAARRAGINIRFVKIAVFGISGLMAAMGGIVFAARLSSVDLNAGGGTILFYAISAAVIGGTSLFGGRGRVVGALLGGVLLGTIDNGLDLIGSPQSTKYMATAVILLAAVTLDTVSRRRLARSGR